MIKNIIAIDTHTHINHGVKFDSAPESKLYDATLNYLRKVNQAANIDKMFCSTIASVISDAMVETENEYMYKLAKEVPYLYQWVVIDPKNISTYHQAEKMLQSEKCVGVKLHPPYHRYTLDAYGEELFSFLSEYKTIVQIHPEKNADYILPFADKYHDLIFIMAHMGSGGEDSYANALEF